MRDTIRMLLADIKRYEIDERAEADDAVISNLINKNVKQLAIILPRGHGKTVLTKASILKDFLFCIIISTKV